MHFDPSINVSTLIAAAGFAWMFFSLHLTNVERLTKIETKVEMILDYQKQQNGQA